MKYFTTTSIFLRSTNISFTNQLTMSNYRCCVPDCFNSHLKAPEGTSWHSFPLDYGLQKLWIIKIRKDVKITRSTIICSAHFKNEDFKCSTRKKSRVLLSTAVPSIFEWNSKEKAKETNEQDVNSFASESFSEEHFLFLKKENQRLQQVVASVKEENDELKAINKALNIDSTNSAKMNLNPAKRFKRSKTNLVSKKDTEMDVNQKVNLHDMPLNVSEQILSYLPSNDIVSVSSVCKNLQRNVQILKTKYDFSHDYPFNVNDLLNNTLSTNITSININYGYWLKPTEVVKIVSNSSLLHLHLIDCKVDEDCIKTIFSLNLESLSFTYCSEWQYCFEKHLSDKIHCFEKLKNLEIFYQNDFLMTTIIYEIFEKMFRHCKELQNFKLFDSKNCTYENRNFRQSQFSKRTTPLPKLTNLVIDINDSRIEREIVGFLLQILKNKIIPLEHVDLGSQTCKLYKKLIFCNPLILRDKTAFLLRNDKSDLHFWSAFFDAHNLIPESKLENIIIKNVKTYGALEFVMKVASDSFNSLTEFHMDFYKIDHMIDGLLCIARYCPQIRVLDVAAEHLEEINGTIMNTLYAKYLKREVLLEALAKLSNLEKLIIHANIFHCKYLKFNREQSFEVLPFCKVTTNCTQLTELRIINSNSTTMYCKPIIQVDTLHAIAHCENLRILYLDNFEIFGKNFDLTKITKNCKHLQKLFLRKLPPFTNTSFAQSLLYAKNLNTLCISLCSKMALTKTVFKNLCLCKNLEKIKFGEKVFIKNRDCRYLGCVFLKLKKLYVIIIEEELYISTIDYMTTAFQKMAKEKPAFYCSTSSYNTHENIPEQHLDL